MRTGIGADSLILEDGRVVGVSTASGQERADAVVLATGIGSAQRLLERAFDGSPWVVDLLALRSSPAVTMQFELEEPCMPVDRVTFGPGTALASFSEQSRSTFRGSAGRLSVILAQPALLGDVAAPDLAARIVDDAKRLGIELAGRIRDYRKVAFPMDFYSLRPGSEALRPAQRTPVSGLVLAGDYTAQPYLTTMEGAVESGLRAARVVREELE